MASVRGGKESSRVKRQVLSPMGMMLARVEVSVKGVMVLAMVRNLRDRLDRGVGDSDGGLGLGLGLGLVLVLCATALQLAARWWMRFNQLVTSWR